VQGIAVRQRLYRLVRGDQTTAECRADRVDVSDPKPGTQGRASQLAEQIFSVIVAPCRAPSYIVHIEYLFAGVACQCGPAFFLPGAGSFD
jgi:hypothetical protein